MTTDPDQIRRDIEATRRSLSADVDTLNEKVNPRYVMERGKGRVRERLRSAKESVMGTAQQGRVRVSSTVGSVGDTTSSAASNVGDAASSATETVRERAEGNPLAAGLIAFGVGWVASSLLPSSRAEQRAGTRLQERVQDSGVTDTVKEQASSMAREVAEQVQPQAQEAMESVRSSAQDAASHVKDEAQSAQDDVRSQAQSSKGSVQSQQQSF